MSDIDNEKLLDEIEASADDAIHIQKEVKAKRKKKSEIPLKFDIADPTADNIVVRLTDFINRHNYTYQDLFDFCINKVCNGDDITGRRLAYNTISGLKEGRDIRSSTIDILCQFLKVDIVLEGSDE